VIQPTQYAVFLSDVETGVELTSAGRYLAPGMRSSCLIFDSLEETEQYCRSKVQGIPNLRCEVFDSHGKANPPVATFVGHMEQAGESGQAGRMMRWPLSDCAVVPLFWSTWEDPRGRVDRFFVGIQLILAGLRPSPLELQLRRSSATQGTIELRRQRVRDTRREILDREDPSSA